MAADVYRGAAREYSLARFGVPTRMGEIPALAISTTSAQLIGPRPDRLEWIIANFGPGMMYITMTATTAVINALPIPPGGTVVCLVEEDGDIVTLPVFVISDIGATAYVGYVIAV